MKPNPTISRSGSSAHRCSQACRVVSSIRILRGRERAAAAWA
jgi:hypothetical protein